MQWNFKKKKETFKKKKKLVTNIHLLFHIKFSNNKGRVTEIVIAIIIVIRLK